MVELGWVSACRQAQKLPLHRLMGVHNLTFSRSKATKFLSNRTS